MEKYFKDVFDFHEKFRLSHNFPKSPQHVDPELMKFRLRFLQEELTELANSCGFQVIGHGVDKVDFYYDTTAKEDLEGSFDAFIDYIYVMIGTMLYMGISPEILEQGWNRVHEANMKKIRVERPEDSKRKSSYDVKKPKDWIAPTLKDLLKRSSD